MGSSVGVGVVVVSDLLIIGIACWVIRYLKSKK